MAVYKRPLRSDEIAHALPTLNSLGSKAREWKNHKYLKKIGTRYFYTPEQLKGYMNRGARSAQSLANKANAQARSLATTAGRSARSASTSLRNYSRVAGNNASRLARRVSGTARSTATSLRNYSRVAGNNARRTIARGLAGQDPRKRKMGAREAFRYSASPQYAIDRMKYDRKVAKYMNTDYRKALQKRLSGLLKRLKKSSPIKRTSKVKTNLIYNQRIVDGPAMKKYVYRRRH